MIRFRQGDLVRVKRGPHTGKVGRIFGFGDSWPDFEGDPIYTFIGVDGEWAPEFPKEQRIDGWACLRPYEIEHFCEKEA